jgi:hypothetical protein
MGSNLADRDYDQIDKDLLGRSELTKKDIQKPNDLIAPAQGYMFFEFIDTVKSMLRKFDCRYWS